MVRVTLTVEEIIPTGLLPTETPGQVDGHAFANDGRVFVRMNNTGASSHDITFVTPVTQGGVALLAVADLVVAVLNSTARLIGPFAVSLYNQPDGTVHIDYESTETESNVEITSLPLS